ncbi:ABC transporter substrate-binding protein [Actinophytocola algeriensis]|uniref:Multiple sugar transport system substrate-binding protein n=1 Tax=Actinophytocola algeriensis TaxID=1768010 RepID=A0A7W7QDF6_9PSEU|nr:sugar ABC transporter substrate-binding protein [Actinophytocola algeriensis]MBB4911514.1 multiple sugar transport system substrate-binding protein [Actinophytocola algeriensis]MBE1473498.1 multiple sugar transport system substrate-binding protein [Actinophytocola algeriensis]
MTRTPRRKVIWALATSLAVLLAGCSSGDDSSSGGNASPEALDAALDKGGTITYWSWTPSGKEQSAAFEKEYPNVNVEFVNVGTGEDHYTALQNAIKAGRGGPDVTQIEYRALPQFALQESLVDLTGYGFENLEDDYTASTWESVHVGDGIYGLPQDSGPMALFYNKEVFTQYGIAVPKTWDDYVAAAQKLHAADPTKYIASDAGDPGFTTSLIWQAGGRPFKTEGDRDVTVNLQDEGTKKWTAVWNKLVEGKLVTNITGWTDEWYRALGDGTIATVTAGAWMPGILMESVQAASGKWAVAPLPTYDGGEPVTAEHGGSTQSVLKQSDNPDLAAAFVRWLNNDQASLDVFLESGGFPATTADLESSEFRDFSSPYFGGQKINEVLTTAATQVSSGWEYLPYQLYAETIFYDTAGQAYVNNTDLDAGLRAWQDTLVEYGNQQGFSVNQG